MPLSSGTRLGAYEVLESIGAGGMGEVYRARDSKLDRDVAVKVLPDLFSVDPDRVARFEREAKSVAHLSHPNILGIFDFGRDGRTTYAVMELLEGETLRARLAGGALSTRRAVDYAVQIAHGLAAAHDKGIAHRDLKPENVFITRDDRAKILDFGLAKPLDLGSASATIANTVSTGAGTVMGTVGYMAPEQLRAQATDHRADIFSFGAVLYEMLAGRRAFGGDTPADTISAILNAEPPDLEAVSGAIPPALDRIVRRCLEKRPELRFQSAHDLAFALETLSSRGSGAVSGPLPAAVPAGTPRRRVPAALPWSIAALGVTAAVASWLLAGRVADRGGPWQTFISVTDAAGEEKQPSISPDGTTIAYATRAAGTWDIYVQRVGGRTATAIAADPERNEAAPAFSPDGKLIAFHESDEDGGIFVAGATGESSRRISDIGVHPAWSPDGTKIAFSTEEIANPASRQSDSAIWIVDVAGGTPRRLEGTGDAAQPSWSPSGERIVYWSNTGGQRDIFTIPAGGGTRTAVVEDAAMDWCPIWDVDGRGVFFASDRGGAMNLWRIAVDQSSGRVSGPPVPVTAGVQAGLEQPAISKDGTRLVFRSRISAINPVSLVLAPDGASASVPVVLNNANVVLVPTDISPDGRWVAYYNIGERQEDLFISALDGSGLRRITDDAARDRGATWLPDGKSLLFYSNRSGRWQPWRIGRDGGNLQKLAEGPQEDSVYPLLSADGSRAVLSGVTAGHVFTVDLTRAGAAPERLPNAAIGSAGLLATTWSADGRTLAGPLLTASGIPSGIVTYDLATRTMAKVSDDVSVFPRWMPDNRRLLYFTTTGQLVVLDVASKKRAVVDVRLPLPPSEDQFALSRDGRTIVYGGMRSESDIWLVERK